MTDLSVTIGGVTLPNPVIPASGTWELPETAAHDGAIASAGFPPGAGIDPAELGAVINKTIFLDPRPGNPPPRIVETPSGMLNSIGIPSTGADRFIAEDLPRFRAAGPPVIVSIAEESVERFGTLARMVEEAGMADLIELDLSCPNVHTGAQWAGDPESLSRAVSAVVSAVRLPVIAKLSPMVRDIAEMARAAEKAGAAAVTLVNTFKGMAIDIEARRPVLGNGTGGLSGPAVRPMAVAAVWAAYEAVSIPIIGMGGVSSWKDAVEFILAGATAVGVGMYNFVNPLVMREVREGIAAYCERHGVPAVRDIVGTAHIRGSGSAH